MVKRDVYTHGHQAAAVNQHAKRTAEDCAAFARGVISSDSNILDVGCGPGSITVGLARWAAEGSVTAIDLGESILEAARNTVAESGVTNVLVQEASVYELPFEDDSFDISYAHQVLQHLTDPVLALSEMARVTRPGGYVAARDADYYTMCCSPESKLIDEWRRIYRLVARENGAEPDAGRYLKFWFEKAGLMEVQCSADAGVYATKEERANWGLSWADRCLSTSFPEQAVAYGFATKEELRSISAGWKKWATDPDGYFHFIHGEALAKVV
jgi:ubiquinone/menaquinone biosynthesis C-methylase UbiE|tara:strand:+ start:3057 stop:3866 length:810 start_codon:yes stop_codon:yes gene_type:complete